MPDISFYHLTALPLEKALPKLMEKVLAGNMRAVVLTANDQRMEGLNTALWTYASLAFLPHGSKHDPEPDAQPIYLSTTLENPNNAEVLVITDHALPESLENFQRCLYFFDGNNDEAVKTSRQHWQKLKDAGHGLTYWKQDNAGAWAKAA